MTRKCKLEFDEIRFGFALWQTLSALHVVKPSLLGIGSQRADALCPHHLDILPFCHVTLRHVMCVSFPPCCPMGRKDVQMVRTQGIGPFGSRCPAIPHRNP
jgi:hypothetical protein